MPDEPHHFYRSYQLSEGKIFPQKFGNSVGGRLPANVVKTGEFLKELRFKKNNKTSSKDIIEVMKIKINEDQREEVSFPITALYSPIAYIPQIMGIEIGRILNLPVLMLLYLGRIFNFLAWLIIMFFAIRINTKAKWPFLVFSLTPISLFIATSLSSDTLTNGISFLSIALFIKWASDKNPLNNKDIILMGFVTLLLLFGKPPYFLLPLLFIFLPNVKYGSFKKTITISSIIILSIISIILLWNQLVNVNFVSLRSDVEINPFQQLAYILKHPLVYLQTIYNSYISIRGYKLSNQFIGVLGWLDTHLPAWVYILNFSFILVSFLFIEKTGLKIDKIRRFFITLLFIIIFISISTSQYLFWTPLANPYIEGLQGRYFISLSALFILVITLIIPWQITSIRKKEPLIFAITPIIILLASTLSILFRYYPI